MVMGCIVVREDLSNGDIEQRLRGRKPCGYLGVRGTCNAEGIVSAKALR